MSTTNHFNLSPMFLNCLLLDITLNDLMYTVHMDKIWFEVRTCGGGGGEDKN